MPEMLPPSIAPRVCLVWRKESSALTTQRFPFVLTLSTPAPHCEKRKKKGHLQFVVSNFYDEKLRCGSRGNMVLAIQTDYVSTIGNRSQSLPLSLLHPKYVWDGHIYKAYLLCFISKIFFTSHRGSDLSEVKKHSVQKNPHEYDLHFYTRDC